MDLDTLLASITGPDENARAACKAHWNSVGKPLGSLGLLETQLERIAALTGSPDIRLTPRTLLIFCADNGVVVEGVSQCGPEVTGYVAKALADGSSSACVMARQAEAAVVPVDMGILNMPPYPGLLRCRVANGTGNIACGPAMTRKQATNAILTGFELVCREKEKGTQLLATGEMGIGNTTTSSALCAALLGLSPELVTGRGAGLSNAGLTRKREAVRRALRVNEPLCTDPLGTLAALGGLDIAAMTGVFLGGAYCRTPVLIDGLISAVAALCAVRLCPAAHCALLASHVSAEPAGSLLLKELGLPPLITAGLRLGEGTGALAAMPLMDMALALYHGSSFENYGMEAYTPQEEICSP